MADLHVVDFYRDVAKIFLSLYRTFPQKVVLYVEDISGPDEPDEFGLHHPRFSACFSTMVWLADEGYLRFDDTIGREALDQAVLTQRAFLLLTSRSSPLRAEPPAADLASPSVLESLEENVTRLRAAVRAGSSIDMEHCVRHLLSLHAPAQEEANC